jgi:hypothetical protein
METGWFNGSSGIRRSKLIGVPAVLVLGIGLMIIGKIWLGIVVMGVAIFFTLITLSEEVGWKAFWFAVAALIFGCVLGFQALRGTIRGQTTYTKFEKRQPMEMVTRDGSPEKFRAAINARWAFAAVGWIGAAAGFTFYRAWRKTEL